MDKFEKVFGDWKGGPLKEKYLWPDEETVDEQEIATRYQLKCLEENIRSKADELIESGELDESATLPSAEAVQRAISKSDSFWDAYWCIVEEAIREENNL